jgi:hypothetical protein
MDTSTINPLKLPESLQQLIDCVGQPAALRLVEWRNGTYLCVPKKPSPDHPIVDVIGLVPFARLVEWYAGETVALPKNDKVLQQLRHRMIWQMRHHEHLQIDEIALKTSYTVRRVYQILETFGADHRDHPRTGDLFDIT